MQASNHIAAAIALRRLAPGAPFGLLATGTVLSDLLWSALHLAGFEMTEAGTPFRSVADMHLVHMPWSHSVIAAITLALGVALLTWAATGRARLAVAGAAGAAVLSHIVLDLLVHAPDIPLTPAAGSPRYGTGLYAAIPFPTLALETGVALVLWRIGGGGRRLFWIILGFAVLAVPMYSITITLGETVFGGRGTLLALVIGGQSAIAAALMTWAARGETAMAGRPARTKSDGRS